MDMQPEIPPSSDRAEQSIEQILQYVVRNLVDHPADVQVQYVSDEEGLAFQIQAHDDDLGQLIGRKGQTARALEAIVNANRHRTGVHYHLDIVGRSEIS
jgi:predicted RNA-binding protein YlqC (UPF0109 family)